MPKYKKRPDGRYSTTIMLGYNDNGSPKKKTLYAKTIKELEEKAVIARTQIKEGYNIFDESITFGRYAERWFNSRQAHKSIQTKNMYRNILDVHIGLLAALPISKITGTHIQEQVNEAAEHPRTAELILLTCRQVFASAINDRIVTFNPCDGISLPRRTVRPKRAFTAAEKRAIVNADYTPEERAFIMLLYCCGLRPAEAYALTWSDIDFKNEVISVNKSLNFEGQHPIVAPPKTDDGIRHVEMHRSLIQPLKEFKSTNKQILLFGAENGDYRTLSNYHTLFRHCHAKIEAALGHRTEITAYYFRHNFCTQLYYSGVSMKEAVRLMGHADSSMIMKVYAHLDSEKEDTKSRLNAINF